MYKKLIVVFFLLANLIGCTEKQSTGEDFSFTTIDGEIKWLSDYRGKIVIVDFMGVNCQPCQYQLLELKKVYDEYGDKVEIISIDVWAVYGETADDVRSLLKAFEKASIPLNWTFGIDDGTLWNKYVVKKTVPTLYIFDEHGEQIFYEVGYTPYDKIVKYIA